MAHSIQIIRKEHRNLAALLSCFKGLVRDARKAQELPDFDLMKAIMEYLESYLNSFHHPKESSHLFPALRRRNEASGRVIDSLEEDHRKVGELHQELREALQSCRETGLEGLPDLCDSVEAYCRLEWDHMSREETEILPVASKCLSSEDWRDIDAAFKDNEDPLFGEARAKTFKALYSEIVARAPAPHGLAEPRRNTS
ncbi:MAG: hemerythrin domain-containing protein [Kiloniellales bacterium]|nr:hemerythrin domain-containing protein [Kiloniellales bacterium]